MYFCFTLREIIILYFASQKDFVGWALPIYRDGGSAKWQSTDLVSFATEKICMNRLQRIGLLKAVFCCLLLLGLSFIQVAPAALADGRTIFNVQDSQGDTTISLDGIKANINAGNYGHVGDLVLLDVDGKNSAHVGGTGDIELGANGHDAKVELSDAAGKQTVSLDAAKANIYAGNDGHVGDLILLDDNGKNSAHVGGTGDIELGANGHDAKVELSDAAGQITIKLDAKTGDIVFSGTSLKSLLERIVALENKK